MPSLILTEDYWWSKTYSIGPSKKKFKLKTDL